MLDIPSPSALWRERARVREECFEYSSPDAYASPSP